MKRHFTFLQSEPEDLVGRLQIITHKAYQSTWQRDFKYTIEFDTCQTFVRAL